MSKLEDMNFQLLAADVILSAYAGRYTMEFWFFSEDAEIDQLKGLNVIWTNHVSISISKSTANLQAICFPQAWRDDIQSSNTAFTNLSEMYNNALAKSNAFKTDITAAANLGSWYWLRCAVSHSIAKYYLSDYGIQTLLAEKVYDNIRNDVPFRHFLGPDQKSSLKIQNAKNNNKKLYLRNVNLFNDYIPTTYQFRHM